MEGFGFFLSTKVDFGTGKINGLGNYCKELAFKKVLIVTDETLRKIGLLDTVERQLNELDIEYVFYDGVKPNPTVEIVDDGGKFAKENKCDGIIAFGGGSSMDTAKGIAIMAVNEGSCYAYLDGRGADKKMPANKPLKLIAVPTTSGTGSEVSMYSVITDKDKIKDSITSADIYPYVAIVDPDLTLKLPKYQTTCTGLDVFGHAIEAYTSGIQNQMTNIWALEAIKLVFENLAGAVNEGSIEYREKMALASVIAGSAMSHCGATIPHALGCPLSGHYNLPHGLTVGVLQIPMIDYNREALAEEFTRIVQYVDPGLEVNKDNAADILIDKLSKLFEDCGLSKTLEDITVDKEGMKSLVHDASIHGCLGLNRRSASLEEIEGIYKLVVK